MKKLLIALALTLPLVVQAAPMDMLAQLPAFLAQLDTLRGKALNVTEKTAVTSVVTQGNTTAQSIQGKFLGGVSKATGLDTATLGLLFPSATKSVSNSDLTSQIEGKLGKKLGVLQKAGATSANTLRNNSLDSLKTTLSNGVAQKVGMDPAMVTGLLPLLGF